MLSHVKMDKDILTFDDIEIEKNFYDFYDKEIPKVDCNHTCLAVINLDSALNRDGNYYPQVFVKECKYNKKGLLDILSMS